MFCVKFDTSLAPIQFTISNACRETYEFNLSEEGKEFEQQRKSFDSENRRSEDLIETLKDPNDVYECIITLLSSLNVSKEIKLSQWF